MGRLNNTRPLLASCLSYATIAGLAELTQQTLQFKLLPVYHHRQAEDFDWPAIGRYVVLGLACLAPMYFYWYRWLDKTFPGTLRKTILIKVLLDMSVFAVPVYTIFYAVLNFLAGVTIEDNVKEIKAKLVPTLLLSMLFWVPAQVINFRMVAPSLRVHYISICTFIEVNILCVLKRFDTDLF